MTGKRTARDELAEELSRLRTARGHSYTWLESRTPASRSALQRYLTGEKLPPESVVSAIARVCGGDEQALIALLRRAQAQAEPPHTEQAQEVKELAARSARNADRERSALLGSYTAASVAFRATDGEVGELTAIGEFWRSVPQGRLVITGPAGSGKTVLAFHLVLQLIAADSDIVPVRLDAARWKPGGDFATWLAGQLVEEFGVARAEAYALVDAGVVLPVLDGLDELTGSGSLVTALNRYGDADRLRLAPVVLTCRDDHYDALTAGLAGAERIALLPLTGEQVACYARARFGRSHPRTRGYDDVLEVAQSWAGARTPWELLLIATAVESGALPKDLERREDLLPAYLSAAVELGGRYRVRDVERWLRSLAEQLNRQEAEQAPPYRMTSVDLLPHLLWPIGGHSLVRALHTLVGAALAVALPLLLIGPPQQWLLLVRGLIHPVAGLPSPLSKTVLVAAVVALSGLIVWWTSRAWPTTGPSRARSPHWWRPAGGLLGGLAIGSVSWLVAGPLLGLATAVAGGAGLLLASRLRSSPVLGGAVSLTVGSVATLALVTRYEPLAALAGGLLTAGASAVPFLSVEARSWQPTGRRGWPAACGRVLLLGCAAALAAIVVTQVVDDYVDWAEVTRTGLVIGLVAGVALGSQVWLRQAIGNVLAALRARLPLRPDGFLRWASKAGILRVSGAAYQFRHAELREWLASASPAGARRDRLGYRLFVLGCGAALGLGGWLVSVTWTPRQVGPCLPHIAAPPGFRTYSLEDGEGGGDLSFDAYIGEFPYIACSTLLEGAPAIETAAARAAASCRRTEPSGLPYSQLEVIGLEIWQCPNARVVDVAVEGVGYALYLEVRTPLAGGDRLAEVLRHVR